MCVNPLMTKSEATLDTSDSHFSHWGGLVDFFQKNKTTWCHLFRWRLFYRIWKLKCAHTLPQTTTHTSTDQHNWGWRVSGLHTRLQSEHLHNASKECCCHYRGHVHRLDQMWRISWDGEQGWKGGDPGQWQILMRRRRRNEGDTDIFVHVQKLVSVSPVTDCWEGNQSELTSGQTTTTSGRNTENKGKTAKLLSLKQHVLLKLVVFI